MNGMMCTDPFIQANCVSFHSSPTGGALIQHFINFFENVVDSVSGIPDEGSVLTGLNPASDLIESTLFVGNVIVVGYPHFFALFTTA